MIGPYGPAADGVFEEQDFTVVDPYGVKGEGQSLYYGDIICLQNAEVCVLLHILHLQCSILQHCVCFLYMVNIWMC